MTQAEAMPQDWADVTWSLLCWEAARSLGVLTSDEAATVRGDLGVLYDARARAEEQCLRPDPHTMIAILGTLVEKCHDEISERECLLRARQIFQDVAAGAK